MISPLIKPVVKIATQACRTKLSQAAPAIRLAVCREIHLKQAKDADEDIEAALVPLFEDEVMAISKGLLDVQERSVTGRTKTPLENALSAIDQVFNPKDWDEPLVNAAAPPLIITTGRAARSQLIMMHVDPIKSTASNWLFDNEDIDLEDIVFDAPQGSITMSIATEWPSWMKRQIKEGLKESFSQPYWAKVNETTRTDVGRFVERGLLDGQSIETMARRMQPELLEEGIYARRRARNIARTESGNALNSGRRMSIDHLAEELGPEVPLTASWLSVLGNTTRDNHAIAHGQLADADGLFTLGSHRIPWPSHFSLPAEERCQCQCTVVHEFGILEAEAQEAVQEQTDISESLPVETPFVESLSDNEQQTMRAWIGGGSTDIRLKEAADNSDKIIQTFHGALDKAPKHKGLVYRGMTVDPAKLEEFTKLKNGATIEYNASGSASKVREVSVGFAQPGQLFSRPELTKSVMFDIKSKSGADISIFNKDQAEVVLRKSTKYRVTKVTSKVSDVDLVIRMEEI